MSAQTTPYLDHPSLRLVKPDIKNAARMIEFAFANDSLLGYEGETIAAALAANGRLALGWGPGGAGRGIFCGMGVCQECLVTVNGIPSQRACATELTQGIQIFPQGYRIDPSKLVLSPNQSTPPLFHEPEILVIGGGPAGMSAARAAALCRAKVILVDERSNLGGQYFKQLAKPFRFVKPTAGDRQFRAGRALIEETRRVGVDIWSDSVVWGAFAPLEIAVAVGAQQHVLRPQCLIIATGAYERGVPYPGWTLPGSMTTGAAQTLQRAYRVAPGRRVLIAGNGPLNFQLAADLIADGVNVVALVEAAQSPAFASFFSLLRAIRASPELIFDGMRYVRRIRRADVPILYGSAVVSAGGDGQVKKAVVARIKSSGEPEAGSEQTFEADAICSGYGFLPVNDIARALGCRHRFDSATGALVVERDDDCLTSRPRVYVVGDSGAANGARAALAQGSIAGIQAVRSLGYLINPKAERELARARRRLSVAYTFQTALWELFKAPTLTHQLASAETIICRCEGVTREAIDRAMRNETVSVASVKRQTRAGMGRCQGKYCSHIIAALVKMKPGVDLDEFTFLAPRPPIKPLSINTLAQNAEQ